MSMRNKKDDQILVPLGFELMLRGLFGDLSYPTFSGHKSFISWKKAILRLAKAMLRTAKLNVESDSYHEDSISSHFDQGIASLKASKTINEVNIAFIQLLASVNFELLGNFPRNFREANTSHFVHWTLDDHRKLQYSQSNQQKINVIFSLLKDDRYKNRLPKRDDLLDVRASFGADKRGFLDWFKKEHPDIYLEVF